MGRGLMTLVSIVSKKDKNLQGQKESTRKCRIPSVWVGIICCCDCTSTYIRYHGGLFVFEGCAIPCQVRRFWHCFDAILLERDSYYAYIICSIDCIACCCSR